MTLICIVAAPDTRAFVPERYIEGWREDIPNCADHPDTPVTVVIEPDDSPMECVDTGRMTRRADLTSARVFEIRWKDGQRP